MLKLSYSDFVGICITIAEIVPLNTLLLDEQGNILYVHTQLKEDWTGSAATPFRLSTIFELIPTLNAIEWQQIWQILQNDQAYVFSAEFLTHSGTFLPGVLHCRFLHSHQQQLAFCWLKTPLKRNLIKRHNEMLEISYQATTHANLMIFRLNAEGFFGDTNEVMELKLGYQEEILRNMRPADLFLEKNRKAYESAWQSLKQGKSIYGEAEVKNASGVLFPIEYYVSPMGRNPLNGYCGIWTDVSERRQKEMELQQAIEEIRHLKKQLEIDNQLLQEEIKLEYNFNNIIARSAGYRKVLKQVEQVADKEVPVLIYGETGTGKELLARTLHQLSPRAERPLVKVNCSAVSAKMLEAELFGYEKGAFATAFHQKKGRLEIAHQGTLFLDEISELPSDLQTKLLRVMQDGRFESLGGTNTIEVDVRIVAATSRNLEKLVREGKFRQDLYYRLHVFPIYNIPLRERREDIPLLVRFFVEKFAYQLGKPITSIPQKALDRLLEYDFPGNVRELENIIERAVILSTGTSLQLEESFTGAPVVDQESVLKQFKPMEQMQREYILDALRLTRGQISGENGAAKLLGMNDKTLYSKMKKLKIDRLGYLNENRD